MKIICKHLGPYYGIQKAFPCRAFTNEFVGELWIEIDEKYEALIYLMFGDSVIRSDYEN
tara:strand:+ start:39039 stop:39215 length:177 start_codon:yes stop_codon:yes gene_type:complete